MLKPSHDGSIMDGKEFKIIESHNHMIHFNDILARCSKSLV